jgi:hypothetical protein
MRRILIAATALSLAACAESTSMALLDHPQILAVRADPPAIPAGGEARIEVLAGDASGALFVVAPETMATEVDAPLAQRREDGWYIVAPLELPSDQTPLALPIEVTLTIDDLVLAASKTVILGAEATNPVIDAVEIPAVVARGTETAILATGSGGTGELGYAWYTSIGELDSYRSADATFLAGDAPGSGEVLVVIRDAQGGVTWQTVPIVVE